MPLWMVRTGRHGEHEKRFVDTNRIYVTWTNLNYDLSAAGSRQELRHVLQRIYPDKSEGHIAQNARQLWPFAHEMNASDWVAVPSKAKPVINIAEITGGYVFDPSADDPYYHYREVKWVARDVPRSNFDKDLLYSLGAFTTICRIERHDAERRIRAMGAKGWGVASGTAAGEVTEAAPGEEIDLEQLAMDQIAELITRRFSGHDLARLVEAVLRAQGYVTYLSPLGPDKGIDILAAPGPLGFGQPRICVQVKSGDSPVDTPTLNQLIGSMQNVHADQGLLVSWGGFKSSVDKELPVQFFRVRLWNQADLIRELLSVYEQIDPDIKADLPLRRIWTATVQEDSE